MSTFVILAVLLTLAALGALAYPLLQRRSDAPPAWPMAGLVAVLFLGCAAALYPVWSNWNWSSPGPAADSPQAMVGRLARRLEKQPDDLQGWLLLGRSYNEIGQFPLAARAYQRADKLAEGRNVEALLGMGDALIAAGRSELTGAAGRLFEKALEIEPNSVQALLYGALAAMERNELPVARARFARLLEGNPPPEARSLIERQLQVLDAMAVMASAPSAPAAQAGAAAPGAPAAASAAVVRIPVRITLAAGVAAKAMAGAPLFVLARVPGQRQPLAAKRLEAKFPQDVELLSTDAMAGAVFTAGQELEVEARVANGGSAISRSGDPFGVVKIKAGASSRASIEINQLKP